MPYTLDKIQRGFSKSAKSYDLNAGLHRGIADRLFDKVIKGPEPSALLDIGCGTGYLTGKLKSCFYQCQVVGLDIARGMIEVARLKQANIDWVQANSDHLPFSDGAFDMVISNLAYQWAEDLSCALSEARRVLVPGGTLAVTLFGYNTCPELFQSLDDASGRALQFARLPDRSKVQEAMIASGFKEPIIDCEQVKIEFKDMYELTAWFKSIGAPHLPREGYLGAGTMARAAYIYQEKFSYLQGVAATFEVIRAYAKK